MTEIVSRQYHVNKEKCCERCVFGTGVHEPWCPEEKLFQPYYLMPKAVKLVDLHQDEDGS